MDSTDRVDFLAGLKPNGKYSGIVGIYRHNSSADRIGVFDKEVVNAIAPSVKWIAHNGAGYDQIDIYECKAKGELYSYQITNSKDFNTTFCMQVFLCRIRRGLSTKQRLQLPSIWCYLHYEITLLGNDLSELAHGNLLFIPAVPTTLVLALWVS